MVESEFPSNMRFRGNRRPKAKRPNWFKNPIPCSSCLRFKRKKKNRIASDPQNQEFQSQMLHVWNIYQHLPQKSPSYVGKYSSTMDPMAIVAMISLNCQRIVATDPVISVLHFLLSLCFCSQTLLATMMGDVSTNGGRFQSHGATPEWMVTGKSYTKMGW